VINEPTGADKETSHATQSLKDWSQIELGEKLFSWRDYTPIPLIVIILFAATPSVRTATIGTLVVIFGELIRIYAVAFIGPSSRTRNTETTGPAVVTDGPFGIVRNPLYVGNFFITFGFAVYSGKLWLIALAVLLFAFQYYFIVKYEEKLLVDRFGPAYEEYRENVPAWLPARLPSFNTLQWPESFTTSLRSERRTLIAIAVMMAALAIVKG